MINYRLNMLEMVGSISFAGTIALIYVDIRFRQLNALSLIIYVIASVASLLVAIYGGILNKRFHRLKAGLCVKCGYDLRATPDNCPECGNVPEKGDHPSNCDNKSP